MQLDEFYWDRVKHEENLFTSRANYFLVGESMLFAGIAALLASEHHTRAVVVAFCAIGLVLSAVWALTCRFQRVRSWDPARKELEKMGQAQQDTMAAAYFRMNQASAVGRCGWIKSYALIGYFMPLVLLVAWLFFLVVELR